MEQQRLVERWVPGVQTSDGAGVRLVRSIGSRQGLWLDPFLMLDEFSSYDADDYIAGFPAHPHRGFQTVTYMLDGHMLHEDHLGNRGDLRPGDVQWMTAGRGIVHSEMPQQNEGRMRGFQLWLNLPAREKMQPPSYQDIPAATIPTLAPAEGVVLRLIAGRLSVDGTEHEAPINGQRDMATDPLYLDVALQPGRAFAVPVPRGHSAFVYAFEGEIHVADQVLPAGQAGILSDGTAVTLSTRQSAGRALVLAGRPIGEPVVQHGPFVMNTREEIHQAMQDYASGALTAPAA